MQINWEVIMWTCITIAVIMGVFVTIYYIISARAVKRRRGMIVEMYDAMKPGATVMFSGMYGKIVKVEEESLDVEIAAKTVIKISKYAVSDIVKKS